jgi:hypothetical protein
MLKVVSRNCHGKSLKRDQMKYVMVLTALYLLKMKEY